MEEQMNDPRYAVYIDGECADDFLTLDDAVSFATKMYGKGYTDDVQIFDNVTEEYLEW